MKKPNILMIMADQLSAPVLPFHGNTAVKAPHLQALAERSTVFDNAYCNFPLCAPARFSLLAGQFATRIGAFDNACEFEASTPTLPYYLGAQGYKTILAGKMHFVGPDQKHGFQERLTTDIYPADFGWAADWKEGEFSFYSPGHNLSTVDESGECFRSLQLDYDEEVEAKSVQRLYDLARDDEQPFFMCVSYTHPHPPFHILPEYLARYKREEINLPTVGDIPMEERDMLSRWIQFSHGLDKQTASEEQILRARHAYYAMVSYIDDKVGKLLETLQRTGFDDNTIVVFTSDHGDMLGERGMWFKRVFFDWSAKVPMIVRQPGNAGGRRIAEPVSHVDLLPTLMDFAADGKTPEWVEPVDGRSLRPLVEGASERDDASAFVEYTAEGVTGPCCMLRRGRYKYVYTHGYPDQLYDMTADPKELRNIAATSPELTAGLKAEVFARWDADDIKRRVLASQARRQFIKDLPDAIQPVWDYQASVDDTKRFVRRGSARIIKVKKRWPVVTDIGS
ncbi:Choline-sulfatase (plasmid) [Variovorax sp. SRS16]|uniref:choline-sulfatase n=1 Tax=Variovorax sp. SRS16 TaxID=282217 RepID=UPI001315E4EA|nr:choline-sulfatase [Variovorax sp. SRS16]VTU46676.1 Choline-sulfatase [Variovorax sp. SRS16]